MKTLLKIVLSISITLVISQFANAQEIPVNDNDVVFVIDIVKMNENQVETISKLRHITVVSSDDKQLVLRSTADASSSVRSKVVAEVSDKSLIQEIKGSEFKSVR